MVDPPVDSAGACRAVENSASAAQSGWLPEQDYQGNGARFEQENERRPSTEELAERLDMAVDKVSDTIQVSGRHISVDAPFVEGEDNSLLDVLTNDDSPLADSDLNKESLSKEVDRALRQLYDRERKF